MHKSIHDELLNWKTVNYLDFESTLVEYFIILYLIILLDIGIIDF